MGGNLSQAAATRQRGRRRRAAAMSEINVTPLVDVMLVLLIIFMVAAPLLATGVPVDLPDSKAPSAQEDSEPLTISLDEKKQIFVRQQPVTFANLTPLLGAILKQKPDQRVFIRADRSLDYGFVMQIMGEVTRAGFKKVALVTLQSAP
jgi:biopolymer transport protein TolR